MTTTPQQARDPRRQDRAATPATLTVLPAAAPAPAPSTPTAGPADTAAEATSDPRVLARAALKTRHSQGLSELLAKRDDLRGVHALADFVHDSVRWTA